MNEFGFISGSEVRVRVNGSVVGGVLSAVCKTENNLIIIEEFLTEKPVYSAPSPSFIIELKTHADPDGIFIEDGFETISFECGGKTVEYSGCAVSKKESRLSSRGNIEYSVVISAGNRSVENE